MPSPALPTSAPAPTIPTICIVGAGPRGTSIVERLCTNAAELLDGAPLRIVVVEPHPAGPGRVWRKDQPDLMWLNTTAADNTMFPDDTVVCDGPRDTGPTFLAWAAAESGGLLSGTAAGEEAERVHPGWFPTRHLYSDYLSWTLARAESLAPAGVVVERRQGRAVDVTDGAGTQLVWLDGDAEPLAADVVVLAQGHHDVHPGDEEAALAGFAAAHDLAYVPRAYSADVDLDCFAPGMPVLVRGAGLAFVDCMVLLFEGRGGRYERAKGGLLQYRPSGSEPRLLVGSRRGVPYHSKTTYALGGPRAPLPHFLAPDVVEALAAPTGKVDFDVDLVPRVAAELALGYYHELWHAHPDRVRGSWDDVLVRMDQGMAAVAADDGWRPGTPAGRGGLGDALTALGLDPEAMASGVPDPADRLDLGRLEAPFGDSASVTGGEGLQRRMQKYIDADLARRTDPRHSTDLGLIFGLLSSFGSLAYAASRGLITARGLVQVDRDFFGFFSYLASGPPPPRLEQLLALSRAGLVEFLGPDTEVVADAERGRFVATRRYGPPVEADGLLDARLPGANVDRSQDPLVAALRGRGEVVEDVRDDDDGFAYHTGRLATDAQHRLLDAVGRGHESRYALGPWTTGGRFSSGIARPKLNAAFFRQNDALARAVLVQAAGAHDALDAPAALSVPSA